MSRHSSPSPVALNVVRMFTHVRLSRVHKAKAKKNNRNDPGYFSAGHIPEPKALQVIIPTEEKL